MRRIVLIFAGTFVAACLVQGFQWREFDIVDGLMWGHEAQYVLSGDAREFNFLQAYGHPGGPVIEGTIAIHAISHIPYDQSVLVFITLFNSIVIAFACALAAVLRKGNAWWVAVFGLLSLSWLYQYATPPSAAAAVLIAFLALLTLFIYERDDEKRPRRAALALWGLTAGLAAATRADVGIFSSLVFLALLTVRIGWRRAGLTAGIAALSFVIFDPFMWFMPLEHLGDLLFKVIYHYADFAPAPLTLGAVATFSFLPFLGMLLAALFLFWRKKAPPLPRAFIATLLAMTAALYTIFLTAQYQATRYFMPILFIWEMFFPLFVFALVDDLQFSFTATSEGAARAKNIFKWSVIVLLFFYNLSSLALSLSVASAFRILPP